MAADRRDLTRVDTRFAVAGIRRRTPAFDILDAVDPCGLPVVIKRARNLDELGRRRFTREARLGRLLKTAGVATVVDNGDDWIAFERLADPLIMRAPIGDETAFVRLLQKVAVILAHLHASGIVHRDLKPSHILFRQHEPVIIDLGVAGLVADDSLEGTEIVGSPAWMAPEQVLGTAPAPAADIWSLCAIAYWLHHGEALYVGDADSVLEARRSGHVRQPDLATIQNHQLAELLAAGFGPAEGRPQTTEFATRLNAIVCI